MREGIELLEEWLGNDHTKSYKLAVVVYSTESNQRMVWVTLQHAYGFYEGSGRTLLVAAQEAIKLWEENWSSEAKYHYLRN
jgi:hypothetical protein